MRQTVHETIIINWLFKTVESMHVNFVVPEEYVLFGIIYHMMLSMLAVSTLLYAN